MEAIDFTLVLSPNYRTLTRQIGQARVGAFYCPATKRAREALDTAAQVNAG